MPTRARPDDWLLTAPERRNTSSRLYSGPSVQAWAAGNAVRPLVDGATYFRRLCEELRETGAGDQVYFVDWRGDPDERLAGPGTAVMVELARCASAGAEVFGLVWRSHLDRFRFSEAENRNLAEALQAIRARVMLDMRIRRGGSHHQKFLVVRHPDDPSRDVAFVGGTDLGHSRNDDARHLGDPQPQPMSARYGPTPPWHDAMLEIRGPAVADVECCFRERWDDPTALRHARPWVWAMDRLQGLREETKRLPEPLPPPPPAGSDTVQLLRTYPFQKPAYPFAPRGERTVALGYAKALRRAERLVYVEDQYLWSREVAGVFAEALRRRPELQLVVVVPRHQDYDGRVQEPAQEAAHAEAVDTLREAGGDRVHLFDLENEDGTPIYVHAKICVVDDIWAAVGSANLNRRSWTHDSELTAAVLTQGSGDTLARRLRMRLWSEHLGRPRGEHDGLADLATAAAALEEQAALLDGWHADGRAGPRPAGRLRPHRGVAPSPRVRRAIRPFVEVVVDPDGRPWQMRRRDEW